MARSDLVIDLVEAQQRGDTTRFRTLVEAIIAEERSNQHHLVADRLSQLITTSGARGLLARVTTRPARSRTYCRKLCRNGGWPMSN